MLPNSTRGLPEYLLLSPSPEHPTIRRPRREWIRRLPQVVKKSKNYDPDSSLTVTDLKLNSPKGLLALFGRLIATKMREDPAGIVPTTLQEERTESPPAASREDHADIPPAAAQDDHGNTSPDAEDPGDTPLTAPQQQISPTPAAYEVD